MLVGLVLCPRTLAGGALGAIRKPVLIGYLIDIQNPLVISIRGGRVMLGMMLLNWKLILTTYHLGPW